MILPLICLLIHFCICLYNYQLMFMARQPQCIGHPIHLTFAILLRRGLFWSFGGSFRTPFVSMSTLCYVPFVSSSDSFGANSSGQKTSRGQQLPSLKGGTLPWVFCFIWSSKDSNTTSSTKFGCQSESTTNRCFWAPLVSVKLWLKNNATRDATRAGTRAGT